MRTIFIPLILICSLAQLVYCTEAESQKAKIIDEDTQFICKYPKSGSSDQMAPWGAVGDWIGVLSLLGILIGVAYLGYKCKERREQKGSDHSSTRSDALNKQSAMGLLDLNDDALLTIIDRLAFIDRARFCGASRRLRALEGAARAIADEQSRPDFGKLSFRVREDVGGRVGDLSLSSAALMYYNDMWHPPISWSPNSWGPQRETTTRQLTMEIQSAMRLFARAVKCCSFQEVSVWHDPDLVKNTLQILRDVKTCDLKLRMGEREGQYDGASPLVSIDPLLWAMCNGGLRFLEVVYARNWATADQLLVLIEKLGEYSITFKFCLFDLETGQKIANQLMGIDPIVFDCPPDDLNEIRTSKKGIELYVNRIDDELQTFSLNDSGVFIQLHRFLPRGEDDPCTIDTGYDGYSDRNDSRKILNWGLLRVQEQE